ncbi:MAG: hypothetical protein Q8P34_04405 [Bacteroidota bacterium]|nr:hypothetical protein [Bacteroidota bacterium]
MNFKIMKTAFVILCLFIAGNGIAATVKITGKAAEYAQNSIELNKFHDNISEETIKLGDIRFNSEGVFELEVELAETTFCFADFDGYHGMIYLEPGKSYQLVFPPKRKLTDAQKRNPFTKPDPVWFGIINPDDNDLNVLIQQFETAYAKYENQFFDQIFINKSGALVDSVKMMLGREFPKTGIQLFESHKMFRNANLEFALHQGKADIFKESYFRKTKPVYNLAAYSNLFNQVFPDYFSFLDNSSHDREIRNMINTAKLQQLDDYFQKKLLFNRELAHWILLKSLKDAYYNKNFNKAAILKMLDQVKIAGWSSYEQRTAQLIRAKLTYLTSGTTPPKINLKDLAGRTVRFSDYPGTYIYLHFTDPKNTVCRQHLDVLKKIAVQYKEKLIIINVLREGAGFKNESGWAGIFATTDNNPELTYKVKTYPNSFLIGKDGKLLLSPAPNPIDGLDRQLGQILKSDHFKEMKKTSGQNVR